ncbi:MAG: RidA family protein [Candidatus Protistobacter heckmanni]|nr:RidA family protein [Candidatus Protistobacter heckmanni]
MNQVEQALAELGLQIPPLPTAAGAYVGYKQAGNLVFISGQLPLKDGKPVLTGKLGQDVSTEQGYELARVCALNILAQLNAAVGGDWSRVVQAVRLGGFVARVPEYSDAPKCINGASELFAKVFGAAGAHARAAVGVASLPGNMPVEVEATFEVKN